LAWTVPDIEAFARITLTNTQTGETAACLQTTLSNGLTTRLLAVKWASAGLVIAAILVGLFHSTLRWSPSPAVYRWYDVLYLFQATASSALLEINYPSVYTNFALNFPWALGLFPSTGIQDAVTDLRNSTGGKLPTMAFSAIDYINRKSSPYNEAIALNSFFSLNSTAADFHSFAALTSPVDHLAAATSLARRAEIPTVSQQDTISTVTNGIPVYVNSVGIPTASAFDSIFIIYLISIAVVLAAHVVWGLIVFLADRFRSPENRGTGWVGHQRRGFWSFFAGNMMRVVSPLSKVPVPLMSRADQRTLESVPHLLVPGIHLLAVSIRYRTKRLLVEHPARRVVFRMDRHRSHRRTRFRHPSSSKETHRVVRHLAPLHSLCLVQLGGDDLQTIQA
jgi:hypothetical protein